MTGVPDTVQGLADHLLACLPEFTDEERRTGTTIYRLLAAGNAIGDPEVARELRVEVEAVVEILARPHLESLTYRDDERRIVGFGGLAVKPMHHGLMVAGKQLYTWCAWDSLFIPPILGKPATIASPCPTTGTTIRVELGPDGVSAVDPDGAVMSFLSPSSSTFEGDVQQTMASFCHFVFFFASPEAAKTWTDKHPGTIIMSIADGFALGQLLNAERWGIHTEG